VGERGRGSDSGGDRAGKRERRGRKIKGEMSVGEGVREREGKG